MAGTLKLWRYDHDLAERCMLKSDYWANPDQWSDRDIRRARIEISRVFKEARDLL